MCVCVCVCVSIFGIEQLNKISKTIFFPDNYSAIGCQPSRFPFIWTFTIICECFISKLLDDQ